MAAEGSLLYRYYRTLASNRPVKITNGTDPLGRCALEVPTGNDFENDVSFEKKRKKRKRSISECLPLFTGAIISMRGVAI